MKGSSKSVKLIANLSLLYSWIILFVICVGGCLVLAILFGTLWKDNSPHCEGQIFYGISAVLILALIIGNSPRWFILLTLTEREIRYSVPFKATIETQYKDYKYIYRASYWHGSLVWIGYHPQFFVLSRRRLTNEELENINQVAPTEKVIKIRYTKRTHKKLEAVLPEYYKNRLNQLFPMND